MAKCHEKYRCTSVRYSALNLFALSKGSNQYNATNGKKPHVSSSPYSTANFFFRALRGGVRTRAAIHKILSSSYSVPANQM